MFYLHWTKGNKETHLILPMPDSDDEYCFPLTLLISFCVLSQHTASTPLSLSSFLFLLLFPRCLWGYTFKTSMKNVQFWHPPHPWTSKLRLPTTSLPTPISFVILAAYRLYLVDVSITYHARATHNSLQLKINLN